MALDANGKLIEETTSGNRPLVHSQKEINAQRNTPQGRVNHGTVEVTATTSEQSRTFDVEWIVYLVNDGENDIIFNFDLGTTSPGKFTLKPGDSISDVPRKCTTLYFKTTAGESAFRALGVK